MRSGTVPTPLTVGLGAACEIAAREMQVQRVLQDGRRARGRGGEQSGGGQERGMRSGTVPTPLTVGLRAACEIAAREMQVQRAPRWLPGVRVEGDRNRA